MARHLNLCMSEQDAPISEEEVREKNRKEGKTEGKKAKTPQPGCYIQ